MPVNLVPQTVSNTHNCIRKKNVCVTVTYLHAAESKDASRHEAERKRKKAKISTCAEKLMQQELLIFKLVKITTVSD